MGRYSILAVFAHPDDETSVGPMLAKYAHEGHDVYLVSVTSGQMGVRADFGMEKGDALGALRGEELRCACRQLGIHEPYLLGFQDQGLGAAGVADEVAARLREVIAETRADVIVTFGPDGVTGHQDHGGVGAIATLVFQRQKLLAHAPRKLYYVTFPESRAGALAAELVGGRTFHAVSDAFITTEVDCREYVAVGHRAIECHRTQWNSERMRQIQGMQSKALAGHVYLRLALSTARQGEGRESSILAGLDGAAAAPC